MMQQLILTAALLFFAPSLFLAADIKRAEPEPNKEGTSSDVRRKILATRNPESLLPQVICDGDSLTAGSYVADEDTYPSKLVALLGGGWDKKNFGVSGQTIPNMQADAVAQVDALFNKLRPKNVCVAWGGVNDIYLLATGLAAEGYLNDYCSGRRAAGFKVIALTMISSGQFTPRQEQYRQDFNAAVRANWTTYADALCDVDADTPVGGLEKYANSTYFNAADKVHLTAAGYAVIAEAVKKTINSLPSTPSSIPAVLVSGAGTPAVNGIYTKRGCLGRDYYNRSGQPNNISTSSILWNGTAWVIFDSAGNFPYYSHEDVTKPWHVIRWLATTGRAPVPTVIRSP